jgi:hypothetical protein
MISVNQYVTFNEGPWGIDGQGTYTINRIINNHEVWFSDGTWLEMGVLISYIDGGVVTLHTIKPIKTIKKHKMV